MFSSTPRLLGRVMLLPFGCSQKFPVCLKEVRDSSTWTNAALVRRQSNQQGYWWRTFKSCLVTIRSTAANVQAVHTTDTEPSPTRMQIVEAIHVVYVHGLQMPLSENMVRDLQQLSDDREGLPENLCVAAPLLQASQCVTVDGYGCLSVDVEVDSRVGHVPRACW